MFTVYHPAALPVAPLEHHRPAAKVGADDVCSNGVELGSLGIGWRPGATALCTRHAGHAGHHQAGAKLARGGILIVAEWDDAEDVAPCVAGDPVPAQLAQLED